MSYLGDEIERQMAAQNLNGSQLAERSQISASQIYKWTNSEQTSIGQDQMTALSRALSTDANDHAALTRAHLLDEKFGPGAKLVSIEIDSMELKDSPKKFSKGEQAVHYLAELRIQSRDVNDLVIDLARCLGAKI